MTGTAVDLRVAIVGFVGVLVGAVVAAFAQYILAVRRERRDDMADWKSVKRSARLVANELDTAQGANRSSLTLNQWTFTPNMYETNAWLDHRNTLAAALSENAWDALTFGIWAVETVRDVRRANFDQPNPLWSLTEDTAAAIEHAMVPIQNALVALKPYASDAPVQPSRLMCRRRVPER